MTNFKKVRSFKIPPLSAKDFPHLLRYFDNIILKSFSCAN